MRKIRTAWAIAMCLCLSGFALWSFTKPGKSQKYENGADIVKAMHAKWNKKWYPNFSFEQRAIFLNADTVTKEEVWQEVYSKPGNLAIRFSGFESGNGVIFKNDSLYTFKENIMQGKTPQVHPLLLLCFDVYFIQPQVSVAKLEKIGFDLSKVTESKWEGRDAYVIGTTDPTDNTTPQFWIDKERLYVLRVLTNTKGIARDVIIGGYQKIENKWVATDITFKTAGKTTMREEYFNMKFPKASDKTWFDTQKFATAKW